MEYIHSISNDDVAALEAVVFKGNIIVVDDVYTLRMACETLSRAKAIGFDTETKPSFKAGVSYKVSLLQLSTEKECFLIRLNKIPLIKELQAILKDPNIIKIGLDVQNDIRQLNALRHFQAAGFVDLQKEVAKLGIEDRSLRKISGIILGKKVSKAQRLSNWEANIFTPAQEQYAAADAWVCLEIYNRIKEQL